MKDYSHQFSKEFKVQDASASNNTIIKPQTMYKMPILRSETPHNFKTGTPRLIFPGASQTIENPSVTQINAGSLANE